MLTSALSKCITLALPGRVYKLGTLESDRSNAAVDVLSGNQICDPEDETEFKCNKNYKCLPERDENGENLEYRCKMGRKSESRLWHRALFDLVVFLAVKDLCDGDATPNQCQNGAICQSGACRIVGESRIEGRKVHALKGHRKCQMTANRVSEINCVEHF